MKDMHSWNWLECGATELAYNVSYYNCIGKLSRNMEDSWICAQRVILLLNIYPTEIHSFVYNVLHKNVHCSTISNSLQNQKSPKCPLKSKLINILWYLKIIEYCNNFKYMQQCGRIS